MDNLTEAAATLGRKGGKATSAAKAAAARENGRKGGRPRVAAHIPERIAATRYTLHESTDRTRNFDGGDYDEWALVVAVPGGHYVSFRSSAEGSIPFCRRCGRYESGCRCTEWLSPYGGDIPAEWGVAEPTEIDSVGFLMHLHEEWMLI